MLARIHNISSAAVKEILLDANTEATWFLRGGVLPDYMRNHPDGERVWQTVHNHIGKLKPVAETLVHIDYWRGNILWDQGKISAVIDWEEAAYGDPAIDVGYCLMELVIMGMMEEAMEFLRAYEMLNGPPANLYFWALAATARPMYDIDSWITNSEKDKRFRRFITNTILRL
jgi:aminoglycoside phosphotransferase (APT) family kinase protein